MDEAVPVHVLAAALFARFRSRRQPTFADQVLSAMRFKFRRPRRTRAGVEGVSGSRRSTQPAVALPTPRTADPTTPVIFGATGDLARRRLLPALYHLAVRHALPEAFTVVGVGRTPTTSRPRRRPATTRCSTTA